MKADERSVADSQAFVYRGSLSSNHRVSFSSVVLEQALWLVVRLGYFEGSEASFPGDWLKNLAEHRTFTTSSNYC